MNTIYHYNKPEADARARNTATVLKSTEYPSSYVVLPWLHIIGCCFSVLVISTHKHTSLATSPQHKLHDVSLVAGDDMSYEPTFNITSYLMHTNNTHETHSSTQTHPYPMLCSPSILTTIYMYMYPIHTCHITYI